MSSVSIVHSSAMDYLSSCNDNEFDLVYIDPPFNTGRKKEIHGISYEDSFDNYIDFIKCHVSEIYRVINNKGSFFFHADYREIHYCKVAIDEIFGRDNFMNEIIWAFDYGGRGKSKWACKHNNILWYVKDRSNYTFNYDKIERIPYASKLCGEEKFARGKVPTDVWVNTIVPTNSKERVGYPTQKPLKIMKRIIVTHTNPGYKVLDCFAGSGTTGMAACENGCHATLVDSSIDAIDIMTKRLNKYI